VFEFWNFIIRKTSCVFLGKEEEEEEDEEE